MRRLPAISAWVVLALAAGACAHAPVAGPTAPVAGDGAAALDGTWRAVLLTPGGELPFTLRVAGAGTAGARALVVNDTEDVDWALRVDGARVTLRKDAYDSQIDATLAAGGGVLAGEWHRQAAKAVSRLPFRAVRGDARRFAPEPAVAAATPEGARAVPSIAGRWAVTMTDADGDEPQVAELRQRHDADADATRVTGTILTPTGDDRFLDGEYRDGLLRLSTFDGSHAYLFHARAQPDGTLRGDYWSRDVYHATFTAHRDEGAEVPDAFGLAGVKSADGRLRFRFTDVRTGQTVSLDDPRFRGKPVVVNVFGSWCPNCNDEAPLLAAWWRRYHGRGLEMVGIAYELTGEPTRDAVFVRKYAERHGIEYPVLLGGTSDKAAASGTLPDLSRVAAFPTTIFIGRDGRVRKIHSGFAGPGTGERHDRLRRALEAEIESLLTE